MEHRWILRDRLQQSMLNNSPPTCRLGRPAPSVMTAAPSVVTAAPSVVTAAPSVVTAAGARYRNQRLGVGISPLPAPPHAHMPPQNRPAHACSPPAGTNPKRRRN